MFIGSFKTVQIAAFTNRALFSKNFFVVSQKWCSCSLSPPVTLLKNHHAHALSSLNIAAAVDYVVFYCLVHTWRERCHCWCCRDTNEFDRWFETRSFRKTESDRFFTHFDSALGRSCFEVCSFLYGLRETQFFLLLFFLSQVRNAACWAGNLVVAQRHPDFVSDVVLLLTTAVSIAFDLFFLTPRTRMISFDLGQE